MPAYAPVGSSPVENVLLCARMHRDTPGFSFEATSLPGHLIQFMLSGRVRQECNGREYLMRPGALIWYHEDELVRGTLLEAPWTFYSVNFIAPTFPPPGFAARLFFPPRRAVVPHFQGMLEAWQDQTLPGNIRKFRVHAHLLQILAALTTPAQEPARIDPGAKLWWTVETELRKNLQQPIDLQGMVRLCGRSQATIARSCQLAVGMPPLKRIKQVRMSLAQGLVQRSALSMTEIAGRVGYARVHEFSRDYRKHFGAAPTHHRRAGR